MLYYKCECGYLEFWGSGMTPPPCQKCPKCNTAYGGKVPIPHEFYSSSVETDDGPKPLSRCKHCYKTKRQIEAELENDLKIAEDNTNED